MKSEMDRLIHLRLRQAQRKERPYILLKGIFLFAVVVVLAGLSQNCGSGRNAVGASTAEQSRQNNRDLWRGHADAAKSRRP